MSINIQFNAVAAHVQGTMSIDIPFLLDYIHRNYVVTSLQQSDIGNIVMPVYESGHIHARDAIAAHLQGTVNNVFIYFCLLFCSSENN